MDCFIIKAVFFSLKIHFSAPVLKTPTVTTPTVATPTVTTPTTSTYTNDLC